MLQKRGNLNSRGEDGCIDEHKASIQNLSRTITKLLKERTYFLVVFIAAIMLPGVVYTRHFTDGSDIYYILHEICKAILSAMVVTFGIVAFVRRWSHLSRDMEKEELKEKLAEISKDIAEQRDKLADYVSSIQALSVANVTKVYENRQEASEDIKMAILDKDVTTIDIIGISLNDFLRWDANEKLCGAWHAIEKRIRNKNESNASEKLIIRILLIDPESHGAFLRGKAEGKEDHDPTRLPSDVKDAIGRLRRIKEEAASNAVCLEARLYRTSPILYMVRTPKASFVQLYYFRPTHRANVDIPLWRFGPSSTSEKRSMHDEKEIGFHFNWLWEDNTASISLDDWEKAHCHGTDLTIREAHIKNMFENAEREGVDQGRKRLLHLIKQESNTKVWIKGISLQSFFRHESSLYDALYGTCFKETNLDRNTTIRILLIDPECEQARYRAYREYRLHDPESSCTYEQFDKEGRWKTQRLVTDTNESIKVIQELTEKLKQAGKKNCLETRLYKSAPEAFILLTDQSVIVEQYHYGNIRTGVQTSGTQALCGKDIPQIEYEKVNPPPSGENINVTDKKASPYAILEDHFNFVFEHCSRPIGS